MPLSDSDLFVVSRNTNGVRNNRKINYLNFKNSLQNDGFGTGGGSSVSSGTSPPTNPSVGDLWFNLNNGRLYIYFDDPDSSRFFWVDVSGFGEISSLNTGPTSSAPYPFTTKGISYPLT